MGLKKRITEASTDDIANANELLDERKDWKIRKASKDIEMRKATCAFCQTEIYLTRYWQRFCSKKCGDDYNNKKRRTELAELRFKAGLKK